MQNIEITLGSLGSKYYRVLNRRAMSYPYLRIVMIVLFEKLTSVEDQVHFEKKYEIVDFDGV